LKFRFSERRPGQCADDASDYNRDAKTFRRGPVFLSLIPYRAG
jgi:hypothetical protein